MGQLIVKENIFEIKTLNALLKSSFLIGLGASNFKLEKNHPSVIFRIMENIVLLKRKEEEEKAKMGEARRASPILFYCFNLQFQIYLCYVKL